jgi:hypothetical protein
MTINTKPSKPEAPIVQRDAQPTVSAFDLVTHLCGSIKGGPEDLATNPECLKGFGQ